MRYLKLYEEHKKPQIGDFVLAIKVTEDIDDINGNTTKFLYNNIGVFVELDKKNIKDLYRYKVKYENVPEFMLKDLEKNASTINIDEEWLIFQFKLSEIEYSKDKENLEIMLHAKKYNI